MAVETDSYTMIISQQAVGSSVACQWTSPRLRLDAKQRAQDLVNAFQFLVTDLVKVRRTDALKLTQELRKVENKAKQLEEELAKVKEALATKNVSYDSLVAQIRSEPDRS